MSKLPGVNRLDGFAHLKKLDSKSRGKASDIVVTDVIAKQLHNSACTGAAFRVALCGPITLRRPGDADVGWTQVGDGSECYGPSHSTSGRNDGKH